MDLILVRSIRPFIHHLYEQFNARGEILQDIAKQLIAAGCDDQSWQAYGLDHKLRMHGPSIYRLAAVPAAQLRYDTKTGYPRCS